MMRLMRKNMMWKVVLTLVFAVVLGCIPITVLAETVGAFEVTGGVNGTDYSYENGVLTILTSTEITIANKVDITTTDRIEVADGVSANIILKGINIDVSSIDNTAAFKIADNSAGNVRVTLFDGTENVLKSGTWRAGLQKNGTVGTLEIAGDGALIATGGYEGAGIGGGYYGDGSNIIISGGSVTATGNGNGAGIGGGFWGVGSNITISGGSVTATGNENGAGIGGGCNGAGSNITISGGSVTATDNGNGAGIGGGSTGDGNNITISGGSVTAAGGSYGAGIGGGFKGAGSNIIINGGSVKAIAGDYANNIGGGFDKDAVIPIDENGNNVFLLIIANPNKEVVKIDGESYPLVTHSETDTNLYVYLPGADYVINVGDAELKYKYSSDNMSFLYVPAADYTVKSFVKRMYTVALGREADEAGVNNWVTVLNAGTHDGAGIAKEFVLGDEFKLRNLSNEQYVDTLYQTFFNREADQTGKDLWMAILESGQTREYVLSNFVNLPEFTMLCESYGIERGVMLEDGNAVNPGIPQFVKRQYTIVLGREAENEGLYNNVLALVVGALNAEQIAKNFFESQEYVIKNKSTNEYVKDLYLTFMNREADTTGLDFWVLCIESGMTRTDVLSEFAKSEEFKTIAKSYGLE